MNRPQIILFALMSLFTQISFGQLSHILELYCSPEYITVNDPVIINYTYGFSSQPCIKDSVITTIKHDTCFQLDIYYNVGDAASPCSDYDSIILPMMASGTYVILFNLYSTGNITNDSDTIVIEVHDNSTVNSNLRMEDLRIYPNPSQNQINISGLLSGLDIYIYNILGQEMKSSRIEGTEQIIDISNLKDGIYLIKVCDNEKIILQNKILIKK